MNLKEIWSQVPPDYFSSGVTNSFLQNLWHTGKLMVVKQTLGENKLDTLVDVGSANGSFVNRLAQNGILCRRVLAVDPYFPPLKFGKKAYPKINFIQADAHLLPLKNSSVDAVIILETLEHVVDPYCTLLELKRIIKPQGVIVVELDSNSLLFRLIWYFWKKLGAGKVWNHAHLTFFNVHLLEQLFLNAGLKIDKKIFFNLGMGVCFLLRKQKTIRSSG